MTRWHTDPPTQRSGDTRHSPRGGDTPNSARLDETYAAPRVLVVDDDAAIRESLRFLLEDEGYGVDEAADGRAALRRLGEPGGPYVVLLDMRMPRLDGAGVLRELALDPDLAARCACIMLTADTRDMPLRIRQLLAQLDVALVLKPFDIDELSAAVERAAARLRSTLTRSAVRLPASGDDASAESPI